MEIDKSQIIALLKQRGDHAQAEQADKLPDKVDTDKHADLLAQHGISVDELTSKLGDLKNLF